MPLEDRNPACVSGVLPDASSLSALVPALKALGLEEDQIEVRSARPLAVEPHGGAAVLPAVAILAGLAGLGLGVLLTAGTALLYPIPTGGKPIVALPVVGLIAYETMMLCAIVATVVGLAWQIRRAGLRSDQEPPVLTGDQTAVTVRLSGAVEAASVRRLLQDAGAGEAGVQAASIGRTGLSVLLCGAFALGTACSSNLDDQPAYQPQEAPRLLAPAESVPRDGRPMPPPGPPDTRRGARLFAVNCAHCHGAAGRGDGAVAAHLTQRPDNLRTPRVQRRSDDEIDGILVRGREAMPAFGGLLSPGERRALIAFLRTLADGAERSS